MCIGTPMRVIDSWRGGALAAGRGLCQPVDTRLVGDVENGQWLLVFLGTARERLEAARAAEIDAALDLLEAAMQGDAARAGADPGFDLPSSLSATQVAALAGSGNPSTQGETP
jgi:hydrogenase expression/formation protein HypC